MNIEKLARHLKEFTLDEIEMIAECDCKTALEQLLNGGKLFFEQELYKYQEEKPKQEFIICAKQTTNYQVITIDAAIEYFLEKFSENNLQKLLTKIAPYDIMYERCRAARSICICVAE